MFALLECLAGPVLKLAVRAGGNALGMGVIPIGDLSMEAWEGYSRKQTERQRREEIERIVQDQKEWRRQVGELLRVMAANQPQEVREMAERLFGAIPAQIQRSLRRPDDPTGLTAPANLALRSAADLAKFLPERMPRYKKGDCPLPNSDLVLDDFLGMGGFGEVWKAVHKDRPHAPPVALKFCTDEGASKSLRREVELLDRVARKGRHPNIVELRYAHLNANPICLEYEYVGGGDLAEFARSLHQANKATPQQVAQVVLQLASAVGFAHAQQPPIVHRDLKPANVLVQRTERGKVQLKVADFGIGGVASERGLEHARETARAGRATTAHQDCDPLEYTPLYASPQQKRGRPADPRDDVYALGVIWYQLLSGDFIAEAPRGEGWRKRLAERGMDPDLIRLLGSCLEDEASDRPPDATKVAEGLTTILKGQGAQLASSAGTHTVGMSSVGTQTVGMLPKEAEAVPSGDNGQEGSRVLMFGDWYKRTFSALPTLVQIFLWLMYGFIWIPLLYLIHWVWMANSRTSGTVAAKETSRGHGVSTTEADLKQKVAFPGFALLIVGLLGVLFNTFIGVVGMIMPPKSNEHAITNVVMGVTMLVCAGVSGLVALGGYSMIQLRRYQLAMVGSVLATVGMCLVSAFGLPVGIWAIVMLLKPEVRSAFK